MMQDQQFEIISQICKATCFHKRGMAFFRHHGDGVLQVLKYCKRSRPYKCVDLEIGLFSLYDELEAQWLTERGCIPQYFSHWMYSVNKERFSTIYSVKNRHMDDIYSVNCYTVDIPFVEHTVFPFLDNIKTQGQLAETIMYLDKEARGPLVGNIVWNDMRKYAPFLHSGNLEAAAYVIQSILNQHEFARKYRYEHWPREKYDAYIAEIQPHEERLYYLKEIAESANHMAINNYLQSNYQRNIQLAHFL